MLNLGDRNLPIDGNGVRRVHRCVCWISDCPDRHLLGVCSAHWDGSVLLLEVVTIVAGGGTQTALPGGTALLVACVFHRRRCQAQQLLFCSPPAELVLPQLWGTGASLLEGLSPYEQWGVGSLQCPTPSWVTLTGRNVKWDKMMTAGLYFGNGRKELDPFTAWSDGAWSATSSSYFISVRVESERMVWFV